MIKCTTYLQCTFVYIIIYAGINFYQPIRRLLLYLSLFYITTPNFVTNARQIVHTRRIYHGRQPSFTLEIGDIYLTELDCNNTTHNRSLYHNMNPPGAYTLYSPSPLFKLLFCKSKTTPANKCKITWPGLVISFS